MLKRGNTFASNQVTKKVKKIPLEQVLQYDHEEVVELLTGSIPASYIDFIKKQPCSTSNKFPMNALNGASILNALSAYNNVYDDTKKKTTAIKAMVDELRKDDTVSNGNVALMVANWFLNTYINSKPVKQVDVRQDVKSILDTYSARTQKRLIVISEALYMPYLVDETLLETVSTAFQKILQANEKQSVAIPFMACAPVSGKSRTLQEIFPKTKQGIQFKENSLEILISFGNTTPLNNETDFEKALCGRVLYSYLDIPITFREFLDSTWSLVKSCEFQQLFKLIAEHWRMTHSKSDEDLYIYLGIDEFTNLTRFNLQNQNNDTRTFLDGIINIIGNSILSLKGNVKILPFFAGLDYEIFIDSIAKSSFNCHYITPYKFTELDEQNIVKKYFPNLCYSKELKKVMLFCNRQPRLLAWLIKEYQFANNLQKAYQQVQNLYKTAYHSSNIPMEVAKWILASVITQAPTSSDSKVFQTKLTVKQLEEKGWISFNTQIQEGGKVTIFAPFPLLKICANRLEDLTDSSLFQQLLKLLEKSSWDSNTNKDFETFNSIFDCVLNKCFIYLGKITMRVEDRFRGVMFGKTQSGLVNLLSFPNDYVLKEVNFNAQKFLDNKYLIVNSLEQCLFNRFMRMEMDFETYTLLWQDRGTIRDMGIIQEEELQCIWDNHFTDQKLSVIGAKKTNCLSIVVTTKTNSATLSENFGIIDAAGLEQYYGKYVHRFFDINYLQ